MTLAVGTPILVFGDDWGRNVSTMQHLFRIIAPRYPVIWVNGIGHRIPTLRLKDVERAVQKARAMVRGRDDSPSKSAGEVAIGGQPLRVIHPRVLPWHNLAVVRAYNRRSLQRDIRRAFAAEGITESPILVTGSPPSESVVGRLGERAAIYLCMDDFLSLPNVSNWMLGPREQQLLAKVDAVVATAASLVESKRVASGRGYHLPQGVHFEHFAAPQPVPEELRGLPQPIIGFAGGVTSPLDFELMRAVALSHPSASVVLVGPVGADARHLDLPNIHVLGRRPYATLPAYVQAFDVGLIPYEINPHTIAVDPLKLLEYMAAGVPVVTTDLPEARKYREAVSIAEDTGQFVAAVSQAIGRGKAATSADTRAFAKSHGWDRRAARLLDILEEVASARSAAGPPSDRAHRLRGVD
jgi:glycosyltransferase involved in cell wall biosynthesis